MSVFPALGAGQTDLNSDDLEIQETLDISHRPGTPESFDLTDSAATRMLLDRIETLSTEIEMLRQYPRSAEDAFDFSQIPAKSPDSAKLNGQSAAYYAVAGAAPAAHQLDGALHTVSGLTGGQFLKALTPTTFGFAAHGLTYSDVGALASGGTAANSSQLEGHAAAYFQVAGAYLTGVSASAPLTGVGTVGSPLAMAAATDSVPGHLTAADHTKFDQNYNMRVLTKNLTIPSGCSYVICGPLETNGFVLETDGGILGVM